MDNLLPKLMEITPRDNNHLSMINKEIDDFYLNGTKIVSEKTAEGFQNLFSDRAFLYPLYKTVESYLKYADTSINPVYLYRFAYKGPVSYSALFTGTTKDFGVGHIDDLIYLFKSPAIFPEFKRTSEMAKLIRMLIDTYINFAKYGWVGHLDRGISFVVWRNFQYFLLFFSATADRSFGIRWTSAKEVTRVKCVIIKNFVTWMATNEWNNSKCEQPTTLICAWYRCGIIYSNYNNKIVIGAMQFVFSELFMWNDINSFFLLLYYANWISLHLFVCFLFSFSSSSSSVAITRAQLCIF